MNTRNLAPWNWFKSSRIPVRRYLDEDIWEEDPTTRLNHIFNNFIRDFGEYENLLPSFSQNKLSIDTKILPRMDISETDNEYIVEADLPGVKEEDLDIYITKSRHLIIKGKREVKQEQRERNYYCLERSSGSFERNMVLPLTADENVIDASFSDGILTIKIPKKEPSSDEVKKIEVNV